MVVLSTVPSTRTDSPVLMALAEVELVPFSYVVEDVSLTVTLSPADVAMVKRDVDTLLTVPDDPPAAGPDRALDPPPPDAGPPAAPLPGALFPAVAEGDVEVVDEDAAAQPDTAITAAATAATAIRPLLLFGSNRRTPDLRACVSAVTEADSSGDDAGGGGGAAPASAEPSATGGPDVALVSWGLVGS
jgi:hypothetical protein